MLRSVATKLMPPMTMASKASRRVLAGGFTRTPLISATVTRRTFFRDPGYSVPEPEFTPSEVLLLDATAWFVALALLYNPSTLEGTDSDNHMGRTENKRLRAGKDRLRHEKLESSEKEGDPKTQTTNDHDRGH